MKPRFNFNPVKRAPFRSSPFRKSRITALARIQSGYSEQGQEWKQIRDKVMKRDNYTCVYCGNKATEVHHVIPAERGGRAVMHNLVAICHECHCRQPGHQHMFRRKFK